MSDLWEIMRKQNARERQFIKNQIEIMNKKPITEIQELIKQVVLAIDFDGTICEASYPEIGKERDGAKEFINLLYEEGYMIVINTCRTDDGAVQAAQMARDFLRVRGIKYHYFNENPEHLIEAYGCDTRKISADVYIDDKCLFDLPTWQSKYNIIKNKYPDPRDKRKR